MTAIVGHKYLIIKELTEIIQQIEEIKVKLLVLMEKVQNIDRGEK